MTARVMAFCPAQIRNLEGGDVANPQKEDGYTPIAHTILEALATHVISPDEWRVLMVILRKTYGWNKKTDSISLSEFARITGITRNHVSRVICKLASRNIIYRVAPVQGTDGPRSGANDIIIYGFQKDFDKWVGWPPNGGMAPKQDRDGPRSGTKVAPKQGHTKERIKKIQKKILSDDEFLVSLKEKFTWVDFEQEMAKIDAWLLANPERQKTRRFVVKWLSKVQKPMQIPRRPPSKEGTVGIPDWIEKAAKEGWKV